jgi:hypothetical protein
MSDRIHHGRLIALLALGVAACGPKCPPVAALTVPSRAFGISEIGDGRFEMTVMGEVKEVRPDRVHLGTVPGPPTEEGVQEPVVEGWFNTPGGLELPADLAVGQSITIQFVGPSSNIIRRLSRDGVELHMVKPPPPPPSEVEYVPISESGGCFITTAVTHALGGADDCAELTLIRAFRDRYMTAEADRRADVARYYDVAPGLVRRVAELPNAAAVWQCLFEDYLQPIISMIEAGDDHAAHMAYRAMVRDLDGGLA